MSDEEKQAQEETTGSERASKMMDGMLKGLKEFGNVAREKAEEFGKMATEKAEELTKLGKLKLDIHQLNRSKMKAFADLGELVFNLSGEDKLSSLAEHENHIALVKSIKSIDEELAALEAKAAEAAHEEGIEKAKTEE